MKHNKNNNNLFLCVIAVLKTVIIYCVCLFHDRLNNVFYRCAVYPFVCSLYLAVCMLHLFDGNLFDIIFKIFNFCILRVFVYIKRVITLTISHFIGRWPNMVYLIQE